MSEPTSGKPPRLAVVAAAMGDDLRAVAKIARAAGFGAIQLDPQLGSLDLLTLSQTGRRELRSILAAAGIDLVGLRIDLGGKGLGPTADIDAALDRIEKILIAAAGLQCPLVSADLGSVPTDEPGAAIVNAALADLGRRADRHGVALAFRSELASFSALSRAIKSADCPWFGIDLDPVAMLIDDQNIDQVFSQIGQLIRHVRGRDATTGAERRTKPAVVGQGSVDWRRLFADLEGAGYRGWITIDPVELSNRQVAAIAGAKSLRSLVL